MRTITERSNEHGTAVIHMGFMLPVLLVLLLGIWQLGVVYDTWQSLEHSAADGARAAGGAPRGHRMSGSPPGGPGGGRPRQAGAVLTTFLRFRRHLHGHGLLGLRLNILGFVVKFRSSSAAMDARVE